MSFYSTYTDENTGLDFSDIEYQRELNIQHQKQIAIENIIDMYDKIIIDFKSGKLPIYNPNLFKFLSQEKFICWVIQNNKNLKELFEI
ncbi:hypothetical protein [Saudi moumouvirus]|uniref:Uncharacterized protein n=1 Tax=Moumouvirus sp. 'Monve' TaxID=1128131 RepID=H2EEU5_9VIRU|nr:hypothetical protein mv_L713 [Moumouvirus Monve]AQN68216.1 hypothetical protein [Saudi moumouvirus]